MLYEFLSTHREEILARTKQRITSGVVPPPSLEELVEGGPIFLAQMVEVLRRKEGASNSGKSEAEEKEGLDASAAQNGRHLLKLGFSVSQVVHGYGTVCQVVTGLLDELGVPISAAEYKTFNLCLDDALAGAVTAYQLEASAQAERREVAQLGFLAHELRNALHVAVTITSLLASGEVGFGGRTASLLQNTHARMRELIDRSLAEVRLRAGAEPNLAPIRVAELFDDIGITAQIDAKRRGITLQMSVEPSLVLRADRELLVSAIANLLQNAIKYSPPQTEVSLRAVRVGEWIHIDIADACGGIPADKIALLFEPFVQAGADRSGVGLGLPIVRAAVVAQGGRVRGRSVDGTGCVFTIELPAEPAA